MLKLCNSQNFPRSHYKLNILAEFAILTKQITKLFQSVSKQCIRLKIPGSHYTHKYTQKSLTVYDNKLFKLSKVLMYKANKHISAYYTVNTFKEFSYLSRQTNKLFPHTKNIKTLKSPHSQIYRCIQTDSKTNLDRYQVHIEYKR